MKKIMIVLLMVFLALPCLAALDPSIDNTQTWKNAYRFTNKPKDTFLQWCVAVEDALDGTDGIGYLSFTATNDEPGTTAGMIYYDLSENKFKYYNSASWVAIESGSAGNSLDGAYDVGGSITVDSGTGVTLTTAAASDSEALVLTHGETGAYPALTVTNAGTDPAIEITTTGTGADITGTSATWSVSKAGAITCVGVDTTSTITLANDETILNDTNNEIQFGNGTEDISFGYGTADTLTLTTDTGVATINFGDLDAFTGVASIIGDAGADFALATTNTGTYNFTIAQSGTGDNELRLTSAGTAANAIALTASTGGITATAVDDLILSVASTTTGDDLTITQTGAQDASILVTAAGTGADAIALSSTAGGTTITSAGASKDIKIDATAGSVYIDGGEAAVDAIVIDASNAAGGLDIDGGTGGFDIDCTGGTVAIDNDGAGKDITITSDAGRVQLKGEEAATDAITLVSAAGDIDIDAALSIAINSSENTADSIALTSSAGGIDITAAGSATEDLNLVCTAGSTTLTAGEDIATAISISAGTGGIDITADGAADKDLDLVCTNGSTNISGGEAIANAVTIAAGAGGVDISSAATFDIDITATGGTVQVAPSEAAENQFKVNATGTIADASGDAIVLETTNGGILLDADNADNGDIGLDAHDDLRLTAGGDMILTVGGNARVVDDDIVSFGTTDNVTLAYDEDGDNNLQIVGPVDFETTYHEFRSNGVAAQSDGTIVGVATGETNIFVTEGRVFEYFVLGAGQTISVPVLTANGLNIMQDEANDEGAEWTRGITSRAPDAYTVETDVFYFKVKFKIETVAELDICTAGFRIAGAYNADMYAYNTYVGLNVNNGTINEVEELNGANAAEVDTGEAWADGATHELETRIAADGTCTWFVDGTAITNQGTTCVFDWTDTDVVIPYFHYLQDDSNGCELELITWETGIYNQ